MATPDEIKKRRLSLGISIGIHALMILLFLFIMAWKEPYPPIPEYGIELNFGLDEAGSGDIQPVQESTESEAEQTEVVTPTEEEIIDETEVTEEELVPETIEPVQEIDTETEEVIEDSQMEESPDVIEPPVEQLVEENKEEIKEITKEKSISEPAVDKTSTDSQSNQENTLNERSSQGDNADVKGDEGSDTGDLDARAIYGTPGGGGGASLDLAGWIWDYVPKPQDTSDEYGRIVFEIKVDDQGEVIGVRTIEKTVSPRVEQVYREEVESLTFSPTSSNTMPAPISTGRITFIIKVK